jgi:hypothetical protein
MPLANGRYIAGATERAPVHWAAVKYSRYKFITVLLLDQLRAGSCHFASETAMRRIQKWNRYLDPEPELI